MAPYTLHLKQQYIIISIMLQPYEQLSRVYDDGWGHFSVQYLDLLDELLRERGLGKARILDIACGTGILALELARRGHEVHGIDKSPDMIEVACAKAVGMANLSFDVEDMVALDCGGNFDLVTCTYDSINYVRKLPDVRKVFSRVAGALKKKGLFVFDSNTKYMYRIHADEMRKREVNGVSFLHYCRYDARRNVEITAFSFPDGTYEVHHQRPYSYDELSPALEEAGLKVIHLYSWLHKIPYSSNTPTFFCVAEKKP